MPKGKNLLICRRALLSTDTSTWSLIDVFDSIDVNQTPANLPTFYIFLEIENPTNSDIVVSVINPNNETKEIGRGKNTFDDKKNLRVAIELGGIIVAGYGAYKFQVFQDDQLMGETILNVTNRSKTI